MRKKSQVTLFIIMGLVVLFIVGFVIYIGYSRVKDISERGITKSGAFLFAEDPVIALTQSCIKTVSIEAGYAIGLYGGYAQSPQGNFQTQIEGTEYNITIVLKQAQNGLLSINEVEQQIGEYIKSNLPKCVNYFEDFRKQGYKIEQGTISSRVEIKDDSYYVRVSYPLTVKIGNKEKKISDFPGVNVPIRIKHILQIANEIVDKSIANPEIIEISYLLDLQKDNIIALYFPKQEEKKTVFILHDSKSSILKGSIVHPNDQNKESNRQYLFIFGLDFSWYQRNPNAENSFEIIDRLVRER